MLSNVWSDIRYAARSLSRSPGFTAAAIVTIALGVGVNAGVFTVLNGVLFRDLPAQDAHELVSIQQRVEGVEGYQTSGFGTVSTAEYRAYRDRAQTLTGVLGHANAPRTTLGGEAPQEVFGTLVTCEYFDVLRVPPSLGRALSAADCEPGAAPVVVLGRELWTTRFAADPTILGRTLTLNRQSFAVVGVAAEGTYGGGPFRTAYFAPISAEPLLRSNRPRYGNDKALWLYLIGRRSNTTSLDQVRAELDVIAAQIDQGEPGRSTTLTIERATPMVAPAQISRGATLGAAAVLMTAFGLILLIACSNAANLLLARGTAKSQELGIRLSLGASRARLIRQLLTESMLISVVGGLLGSLLALWLFQVLVAIAVPALSPPEIPTLVLNISPDFRVLAFAVVLTLGTGLLFGFAPALQVSKPDLNAVLKQDTAGTGGGRRGGRLRGALVGVQVAVCMTLMIGAGLLLRGLYATYSAEVGFEYRDVAFVSLETWLDGRDSEEFAALRQRFQEDVAALPGVTAVAYTDQEPLGDDTQGILIRLPADGETDFRLAQLESVTPEYFSLLELPIVRGRSFTVAEVANRATNTRPAIVSETTARNLWPEGDAIGQTLLQAAGPNQSINLQIVGVAADAQVSVIGQVDPYYVYQPGGGAVLLVKSRIDFAATASSIRTIVRGLDPTLVTNVFPLEATLSWWRGISGIVTTLGAGLGALALVLAAVGIYGVVAYAVTRRYREIGIRMALGASVRSVLGMVLRRTLRPVAIGAVIGVVAAIAVSGILSSVLFGVSPADPVGLGGAALLVLAVALAAGVMAARPATRTNPTVTLRHE